MVVVDGAATVVGSNAPTSSVVLRGCCILRAHVTKETSRSPFIEFACRSLRPGDLRQRHVATEDHVPVLAPQCLGPDCDDSGIAGYAGQLLSQLSVAVLDTHRAPHPPSAHPMESKVRLLGANMPSTQGFRVEAMGLEPTNLLTASQALYQLSYAPVAAQSHSPPSHSSQVATGVATLFDRYVGEVIVAEATGAAMPMVAWLRQVKGDAPPLFDL